MKDGKQHSKNNDAREGKKILLVDDEPYIRQSLKIFLEADGFDVCTACDGMDGLEKLEEFTPDLIVVDLMMPKMDGHEFAKKIRMHPSFSSVPIIAVSALAQERDKLRSMEAGINEHFTKPFQPEHIIDRIKSILG